MENRTDIHVDAFEKLSDAIVAVCSVIVVCLEIAVLALKLYKLQHFVTE